MCARRKNVRVHFGRLLPNGLWIRLPVPRLWFEGCEPLKGTAEPGTLLDAPDIEKFGQTSLGKECKFGC